MAAFSIGMTFYISIVKETYNYEIVFVPGLISDAIVLVIFGFVWNLMDAEILTIGLFDFCLYYYESRRIITNLGIKYDYNNFVNQLLYCILHVLW